MFSPETDKLTTVLESLEGGKWPQKQYHDQSPLKSCDWAWMYRQTGC